MRVLAYAGVFQLVFDTVAWAIDGDYVTVIGPHPVFGYGFDHTLDVHLA